MTINSGPITPTQYMCHRLHKRNHFPCSGAGTLTYTEAQMQRKMVKPQEIKMSDVPRSVDCCTHPRVPLRSGVVLKLEHVITVIRHRSRRPVDEPEDKTGATGGTLNEAKSKHTNQRVACYLAPFRLVICLKASSECSS